MAKARRGEFGVEAGAARRCECFSFATVCGQVKSGDAHLNLANTSRETLSDELVCGDKHASGLDAREPEETGRACRRAPCAGLRSDRRRGCEWRPQDAPLNRSFFEDDIIRSEAASSETAA